MWHEAQWKTAKIKRSCRCWISQSVSRLFVCLFVSCRGRSPHSWARSPLGKIALVLTSYTQTQAHQPSDYITDYIQTHFNETFENTHWRKVKQIILTSDWDTSSQTHRLHYIRDTSFQRRNTCGWYCQYWQGCFYPLFCTHSWCKFATPVWVDTL